MFSIHIGALCAMALFVFCFLLLRKPNCILPQCVPLLVFPTAFILRCALGFLIAGLVTDFEFFGTWAELLYRDGLGAFYYQDMLVDYPPGSLYFLWAIGALQSLFHLSHYSRIFRLLLKLPAILFDMGTGILLYHEGKRGKLNGHALVAAVAYLFNPAIVINSSVWGQVDSFLIFPLLLMCLFLMRGKMPQSYLAYGIGILLKPQMIIFTPVLLLGILDQVFLRSFNLRKLFYNLFSGLGVIAVMLILCLPFHLDMAAGQFFSTLGSYPYASFNAFNFWNLVGLNCESQDSIFIFLRCQSWGNLVILGIVFAVFFLGRLMKNNMAKYPILAAFSIMTMFTFSVRMHERYMFAGLGCLLFAYLCQPAKKLFFCYSLFSIAHFYNVACIFLFYENKYITFSYVISIVTIVGVLFLYFSLWQDFCSRGKSTLTT